MYSKKPNKAKKRIKNQKSGDFMRRFHDIVIRYISGQYLIEVRDATTSNRLAEIIVPGLEDVKRFLDNSLKEESIDAIEKGQQQVGDSVEH